MPRTPNPSPTRVRSSTCPRSRIRPSDEWSPRPVPGGAHRRPSERAAGRNHLGPPTTPPHSAAKRSARTRGADRRGRRRAAAGSRSIGADSDAARQSTGARRQTAAGCAGLAARACRRTVHPGRGTRKQLDVPAGRELDHPGPAPAEPHLTSPAMAPPTSESRRARHATSDPNGEAQYGRPGTRPHDGRPSPARARPGHPASAVWATTFTRGDAGRAPHRRRRA